MCDLVSHGVPGMPKAGRASDPYSVPVRFNMPHRVAPGRISDPSPRPACRRQLAGVQVIPESDLVLIGWLGLGDDVCLLYACAGQFFL